MRVLLKITVVMTFAFLGFSSMAQVRSLENLDGSEKQSVNLEISKELTVTVEPSAEIEGAKTLITKAERQAIGRLKNIYKIDDEIYRSEQPAENDFISLEKMGLLEVLNVRRFWRDNRKARKTNLKLHHISMKAGDIKEREVIKALKIINDREGPLLIHCWHGSDRTGMLIAMYRLVFQNWTKDNAIDEMTKGDFGFHSIYSNLIDFVRDADIDKIRDKVLGKKDAEKMERTAVKVKL